MKKNCEFINLGEFEEITIFCRGVLRHSPAP